ncbi:transmembrane protein 140-like [Acipenser ruthenus]|uniref:transmembrane protein 140-like n=1 Tax=Acipenser ruthenus TaxID=7906 RepID=UPI0027420006|nr:transmembrane protein 140-like [Acipenser ruthenus]XP_058842222.1 transmembrane protein 140-like [Acipenser ruthenus]
MDDSPPQHRRLSLASIFCLLITVLGMLLFALQFHGGEFIVGDDVAVGLYSFCLPNETTREMECYSAGKMKEFNISLAAIFTARICTYTPIVLCLFALLAFLMYIYTQDKSVWALFVVMVGLSSLLLLVGITSFLGATCHYVDVSKLSLSFFLCFSACFLLGLETIASWNFWCDQISGSNSAKRQ